MAAEAGHEKGKLPYPLLIGLFMHSVKKGDIHLKECRGHGLIGEQHEILNEPCCIVSFTDPYILSAPVSSKHYLCLRQVKVQGAVLFPAVSYKP